MFELKALTLEAIPAALEKALRYRVLNQPEQAESICEDVLRVEPDNQEALAMLILARTDRFGGPRAVSPQRARELLPRLQGEYERAYYDGIIWEREAIARLRSDLPGMGPTIFACFRRAMECYQRGEHIRPPGNDDALLRWNSCVRIINAHPDIAPAEEFVEVGANLGE
jgi:hypothetical protein